MNNNIYPNQSQLTPTQRKINSKRNIQVAELGFLLLTYHYLAKVLSYGFYYVCYGIFAKDFTLSWRTVVEFFQDKADLLNSTSFKMSANISIVSASLLITMLIAGLFFRITVGSMFKPDRNNLKTAAVWIAPCFVFNMIFSLVISYVTSFLSTVGVSVPTSDFSINKPTVWAVILQFSYIIIIAPIIEETVYRGFILKVISPYNKTAAIIISALAFGLMHGNIPQAVSAFATGLIYAIIAVKCNSIIPTIIIHSVNNIIANFSTLASAAGIPYSETIFSIVQICLALAGFLIWFTKLRFLKITENTQDEKYAVPKKIMYNPLIVLYFIVLVYEIANSLIAAN